MNPVVRVEKIITGGFGLARLEDGMIALIRHVLPQELVSIRVTRRRRGYLEAEAMEIVEASPDRVEPPCPVYRQCGGCDLQHCALPAQLAVKQAIVRETLERAGVVLPHPILQPVISSPQELHYRHRIRFKLSGAGQAGFFRPRSNELVPVPSCLLAADSLNKALAELRDSSLLRLMAPFITEIDLQHSPADGRVYALLHPDKRAKINSKTLSQACARLSTIDSVLLMRDRAPVPLTGKEPEPLLRQDFPPAAAGYPYSLSWSSGCFFQVNAAQNIELVRQVCLAAGPLPGQRALDLYCGMGNFSIPLGLLGARVTGVEQNPESVLRAGMNARQAPIDAEFRSAETGAALRELEKEAASFELVVLDPPRQGIGPDILRLAALCAQKIIYISCDPATLGRDLALLATAGYGLNSLIPLDMFPQTHHIECIGVLEKI